MLFDSIIRNGLIVDGTGGKPYMADIGVKNGKIAAIGLPEDAKAIDEIDASGLAVLPGFIDTHVHSDLALLRDKQHANGLAQGVTTEILGQDGISYAPLSHDNLKEYIRFNRGLNGPLAEADMDFSNVDEFLTKFDGTTAINAAYNVPHGTVRLEALGFHDLPLRGYQLEKAKDLLRESFEQGAVGFSTGLSYYPHSYSDTQEMVELCSVCAEYDVPLVIHLRTVPRPGVELPAVPEALEIGRRSGCAVHFSHTRTSAGNAGQAEAVVAPMEAAIARGQKVTMECYPYYSGSGYPMVCLPPWAVEGGCDATLKRLADPTLRAAIVKGMQENVAKCTGTFTHVPHHPDYVGRDFADVANERGQVIEDMMCDLLLEEDLDVGYFSNPEGTEEEKRLMDHDFIHLLSKPYYMIGSDAIPYGPRPHPRAFGAFPRFFRLAREQGMKIENFAYHASALPADTFKLKGRGRILRGNWADLVVLDAERVTDQATYTHPRRGPKGIEYVLVNGQISLWQGQVNGIFAGKGLRRGK